MPTSRFASFDMNVDNGDGSMTPVPSLTLKVWDATNAVALPDILADSSGHVEGQTLDVVVGTIVRFRLEHDGHGRAGYEEKITTSIP